MHHLFLVNFSSVSILSISDVSEIFFVVVNLVFRFLLIFLFPSLFRCMGCKFNCFISDCGLYDFPKSVWVCVTIY